jgi:hypothetical protein
VGFDNNFIMVYMKKKPKTFQRGHGSKVTTSVRKRDFDSTLKFNNTISLGGTVTNGFINSAALKSMATVKNPPSIIVPPKPTNTTGGLCNRLYTMSEGYDNYMCLGCC